MGVCLHGICCAGCIANGVCFPGTDGTRCGRGGNDCFDCTKNAAGATCDDQQCTGCDATSCTAEERSCGTSSCGFDWGGCADSCLSGALTHYACIDKHCQSNGAGNCGLYATCVSSTTCNTTCAVDGNCVPTAWCDQTSMTCKPKGSVGASCSGEVTGDRECGTGICSWRPDVNGGFCTTVRCDKCKAASATGLCDYYVQWGKNPRSWCVYQAECRQAFCSGQPQILSLGTQKEGCDIGTRAVGGNRECGSSQCANGQVTGVCTLVDSTSNWDCDPTFSIACQLTANNKTYACPCINANFCSVNLAQCTPM
jgi:hypothetical protein